MIDMSSLPEAFMDAGNHTVRITEVSEGWKGSDVQLEVTMENTDGATYKKTFTLSEKAGVFFKRFAIAAGFGRDAKFEARELIGRSLNITLERKKYVNRYGEEKSGLEIVSQSPAGSAPPHIAPAPASAPRQAAPPQTTTPPRRAPAENRAPDQEYFNDGSPVPADPEDDGLPF